MESPPSASCDGGGSDEEGPPRSDVDEEEEREATSATGTATAAPPLPCPVVDSSDSIDADAIVDSAVVHAVQRRRESPSSPATRRDNDGASSSAATTTGGPPDRPATTATLHHQHQPSLLLLMKDADRLMARQCRMMVNRHGQEVSLVAVAVEQETADVDFRYYGGDSRAPDGEDPYRGYAAVDDAIPPPGTAPSMSLGGAAKGAGAASRDGDQQQDDARPLPSRALHDDQVHYYVSTVRDETSATTHGLPFYYVNGRNVMDSAGDMMSNYSSLKDSYVDQQQAGLGFDEDDDDDVDEDPPTAGTAAHEQLQAARRQQQQQKRDGGGARDHDPDDDDDYPSALEEERVARVGEHRHQVLDDSGKATSPDSNVDSALEVDEDDDGCTWTGAPDSDYATYHVQVNRDQDDKAVDIPLYSCARPHMRAFHLSWMSFFVAFFVWFGMSPLLGEIGDSLQLTHEQIWTSSCLAVASSAVTRVVVGPLTDMFGARRVMAVTLVVAALPTALSGAIIHNYVSLYIIRSLIGIAGSAFVTCQYWTSQMFTPEIAGTANALVAGWGNLGGGVAQIVVGSILFPIFKIMYGGTGYTYHAESDPSTLEWTAGGDDHDASTANHSNRTTASPSDVTQEAHASELAWRTVLVLPALLAFIMAWVVVRYSDDTPKGQRSRRTPSDDGTQVKYSHNLWDGMRNRNTAVLFVQYACCFGCELALFNAATLYFTEEFGQSTEAAAAIASVFGWTNLFARGAGGFCSDMANAKSGMRGRLYVQSCFLILQGVLIMAFAVTHTLAGSIITMILLSLFLQASEGSTFAIVPYVLPEQTGSVVGWVGAGGNVGGVCFTLLFRSFNYQTSFLYMGGAVSVSAILTILIAIPGHRNLLCGQDSPIVYEHRRRAKLPQAVAFVRPDADAGPPPNERAVEPTPADDPSEPTEP